MQILQATNADCGSSCRPQRDTTFSCSAQYRCVLSMGCGHFVLQSVEDGQELRVAYTNGIASMTPSCGEITMILQRWDTDRNSAVQDLTPIVYAELRKIAVAYLRKQRPDHTLQPTALVHEAYLRLVRQDEANLKDRSHFYTLAARMMRQILVDSARAHRAGKRGSGNKVALDECVELEAGKPALDFM